MNYSIPVQAKMSLAELRPHLHTLPDQPDWIPYRTSYYKEDWGFCLPHRQLEQMPEDEYEVCIDSTLQDGHLTYGECLLKGESEEEVLISCHACHPSLCNDNLSGVGVATFLAKHLAQVPLRYSYRFLFIPGTIGSITWLSLNEERAQRDPAWAGADLHRRSRPLQLQEEPPRRRGNRPRDGPRAASTPGAPTTSSIFLRMAMTSGNTVRRDSTWR